MVQVRGYSEDDVEFLSEDFTRVILSSLQRALDRTAEHVTGAVTAASSAGMAPSDLTVFTQYWQAEVDGVLTPYVSQVYTGSAASVAVGLVDGFPLSDNPGVPLIPDDFALQFLTSTSGDFVSIGDDVWEDVRAVLVQGVQAGESTEQIAAKIKHVTGFSAQRATLVARTATHSAAEAGSIAQLRFVGYADDEVVKEWIATHDFRTRPSHEAAHKQKRPLNEKFSVGTSSLDFPGDPGGSWGETTNCRCTVVFEIGDDNPPKLRCSGLVAAPASTYCVTPVPKVDYSHVSSLQLGQITQAFLATKVTPAYGGAKIHKTIDVVRAQTGIPSTVDNWHVLAIMDDLTGKPYTQKYAEWLASPAGAKAAPHIKLPIKHVTAPTTTPSTTPALPPLPTVAPKPNPSDIKYTGKTLGTHGAQVWENPTTGERWLFKPQPQYATDLDVATSRIQSKAHETRPGVYTITLNGQSGSIQYMFKSTAAWPSGLDPKKLSPVELQTIQQAQILDWLISNHDAHADQWIRLDDGSLFETDKGQSFKFFGSDKLDWDYQPNYPIVTSIYHILWKAYTEGKIDGLEDPTKGPLGEYLERLMAIPDDEYRKLLQPYAAAKGKPDEKTFLDLAVLRKNNLKKDFAAFWARAQAERAKHVKAPTPPTPPPSPPPPPMATSVGVSGDISGYDHFMKQDVMEMWEAMSPKKVTPAYGGAKIWKQLVALKQALDDDWAANGITGSAPNELQILRILDEVNGSKGKSYESVLFDWLDSAPGKKAVPTPPLALKKSAAAQIVAPTPPKPTPTPNVMPVGTTVGPIDEYGAGVVSATGVQPSSYVFTNLYSYAVDDIIAYGQQTMGGNVGAILRLKHSAFPGEIEVQSGASGKWVSIDYISSTGILKQTYSDKWYMQLPSAKTAPTSIAVTSKVPGKSPGDLVTVSEIESSKYLWSDGDIIAEQMDGFGGRLTLVSDGLGGITQKYQPDISQSPIIIKIFPASKTLPNNMSGAHSNSWKLGPSAITSSSPSKIVTSSLSGKNAGDVIKLIDLKNGVTLPPGKNVVAVAYAFDDLQQVEHQIISVFGVLRIRSRTLGQTVWKDLNLPDTDPAFATVVQSRTWYAAHANGDKPDAYTVLLPKTTGQPVGATVPSNIPGKNFAESVTKMDIEQAGGLPPGTIIAEAMHSNGSIELRFIIGPNGMITPQMRVPGGQWTDSFSGFDVFYGAADTKGWYASIGSVTQIAKQAATPVSTATKLTAGQTHVPGKVVGDTANKDDIWGVKDKYADGVIIATAKTWNGTFRIFMADGKLIQQKQSKSGTWISTTIIDNKWTLITSTWKLSDDSVLPLHLKNAKKFVAKKTTPASQTPLPVKSLFYANPGDKVTVKTLADAELQAPKGTIIATGSETNGTQWRLIITDNDEKQLEYMSGSTWVESTLYNANFANEFPSVKNWVIHADIKKITPQAGPKFVSGTPAGSYTPLPPIPEAAKFTPAPLPKPKPVKPLIPPNLDLSGFTVADRTDIATTFKATKLRSTSNPEQLFKAMEKIAKDLKAQGGKWSTITVAHVIRFVDEERDKRLGLSTPTHTYENNIVQWWTTSQSTPGTSRTTVQVYDAPTFANVLPQVMHRLDDPSNPHPDQQKYRVITPTQARALQKDMEAKYGSLTAQQQGAIQTYTGSPFREINHVVRDGDTKNHYYQTARMIAEGMRPSTTPIKLLRFTGWSEFFDASINSAPALQAYVGHVFAWRRFVSSTIATRKTYAVKSEVALHIEAPIGTPMVYASHISHNDSEQEMLLGPNTLFRIIKVESRGSITHVTIRVVGVVDANGAPTP